MTSRRRRASASLVKAAELALAVPVVVAQRSARMLAAGANPGPTDRREFARMGQEKVRAFGEAYFAIAASAQRMQIDAWLVFVRACCNPWAPFAWANPRWYDSRRASRAAVELFASGLAPLHRTATANARRLGRHRSRK